MSATVDRPDAVVDDELVTFRVRRSTLFGSVGVLIGFASGFAAAWYLLPQRATAAIKTAEPTAVVAAATPEFPVKASRPIPTEGRPARGPADAAVTIVEFTDYECPFCRQHFSQTLPKLLEQYGDRVRYVVLNYPLVWLHPDAVGAAEAAECAAAQNRFWEYHDGLLVAPNLKRASLTRLAARLKLDRKAFASCLDTRAHAGLVGRDISLGDSLGVTGTPAFFINGRMIDGAQPFPVFQAAIDSALVTAADRPR